MATQFEHEVTSERLLGVLRRPSHHRQPFKSRIGRFSAGPLDRTGWWRMQSVSNLSQRGIPCEQGKEQGIFRFSAFLATDLTDYCSNLRSLAVQFPTHQSREFDFVSREFRGRAAKYQNRVSVHRSHTSWSAITSMLRCCPKGWVDRDRTVMFMKGCPA